MKATRRRKSMRRSGLVWHKPLLQRPPRLFLGQLRTARKFAYAVAHRNNSRRP